MIIDGLGPHAVGAVGNSNQRASPAPAVTKGNESGSLASRHGCKPPPYVLFWRRRCSRNAVRRSVLMKNGSRREGYANPFETMQSAVGQVLRFSVTASYSVKYHRFLFIDNPYFYMMVSAATETPVPERVS